MITLFLKIKVELTVIVMLKFLLVKKIEISQINYLLTQMNQIKISHLLSRQGGRNETNYFE
ncbi:hypothetical protein J2TS6_01580 [Paenibacillus albilobatus]|uniref:Uncharacterized protein n=1 Tax=Paenibacillus albilobatus TaxID=2716884 RepID=A0A919XDS2_9BACL|nr:hypothetical protein J2TS6_01580 [Paenibacillus albilobatus]